MQDAHKLARRRTTWRAPPCPQRVMHNSARSSPPADDDGILLEVVASLPASVSLLCLFQYELTCRAPVLPAVDDDILLEVVMFVGVLCNEGTAPLLVESGLVGVGWWSLGWWSLGW